jgi:hypothetical protein
MVGFALSLACRMNVPVTHHEPLNADALRSRFKARHDAYGEDNRVRIHRALSWLRRAEQELEDPDARFIFLWIAFNASYAHEFGHEEAEREQLSRFFARLLTVDGDGRLHALLFQRFSGPIRTLIDNRYVFAPFWRALREHDSSGHWEESFSSSKQAALARLLGGDTLAVLSILFERLYVLRCSLVHGGATWRSQVNRAQVQDGVNLLHSTVPVMLDLMIDHPSLELGAVAFPVVSTGQS